MSVSWCELPDLIRALFRAVFTRPVTKRQAVRKSASSSSSISVKKLRILWLQFEESNWGRRLLRIAPDPAFLRLSTLAAVAVATAYWFSTRQSWMHVWSPTSVPATLRHLEAPAATNSVEDVPPEPEMTVATERDELTAQLAEQASAIPVATGDTFKVPGTLRTAVAFWQRVFGVWGAGQVALHDNENLGIVYKIIALPDGSGGARLSPADQRLVDQQRRNLCANLNDLEYRLKKRMGLTGEQQRLYRLLTGLAGRHAIRGAADRVRVQRGMRASFRQGLAASGKYETAFRQVFREQGLPDDLVYLAHVESAFTSTARSPAGAVGVWQFMPETGKRFLKINTSLDERYDPVLSTRGAARYFSLAYDKLGDWGLAITSFNYGLTGTLKAKSECGSDIECVVQRYTAPNFGFASRNYYAEFLAIRSIVGSLDRYFPEGVNFAPPLPHKRIRLARAVPAQDVARMHGLSLTELAGINPAWTHAAAQGRIALPVDAEVWIPAETVARGRNDSGVIARVEGEALLQP